MPTKEFIARNGLVAVNNTILVVTSTGANLYGTAVRANSTAVSIFSPTIVANSTTANIFANAISANSTTANLWAAALGANSTVVTIFSPALVANSTTANIFGSSLSVNSTTVNVFGTSVAANSTMVSIANEIYANNSRVGVNTSAAAVSFHISANDAISIPVGNTGQRPTAANGYIRYNAQTNRFEAVANSAWTEINTDLKIFNVSGTQLYPTP